MAKFKKKTEEEIAVEQLNPLEQHRRRQFNTREREAIFILSGGICASCGELLDDTWEPDHIVAFARGGETHIDNAQALCRPCNRHKGGK